MTDNVDVAISRPRGRPARVSRDQIIAQALALLETEGFEAFSMPRLGRRLGVSPMALYKHFSGRDEILDTVAREIAQQFRFDPARERWDDDLLAWFKAFFDLFERYPIAIAMLKLDQASPAWLRIWAPLAMIMSRMGLSKGRLSFATSWASSMALGLIMVHNSPTWRSRQALFGMSTGIDTVDSVLEEVDLHCGLYERRHILDFGALCAVESIRKHFADTPPCAMPAANRENTDPPSD
jgi:AcrR family transcriptional regulator